MKLSAFNFRSLCTPLLLLVVAALSVLAVDALTISSACSVAPLVWPAIAVATISAAVVARFTSFSRMTLLKAVNVEERVRNDAYRRELLAVS